MPPATSPWSDDKVEELRRLWAEGFSATEIAKALAIEVTRCGVLGKVMRLGLAKRKSSEFKPGPPRPKRPIVRRAVFLSPKKAKPVLQESPPKPPKPRRLTLMQLGDHHCKWPVEDHPFRFCGAYRERDNPYCRFHMEEAFQKPRGPR